MILANMNLQRTLVSIPNTCNRKCAMMLWPFATCLQNLSWLISWRRRSASSPSSALLTHHELGLGGGAGGRLEYVYTHARIYIVTSLEFYLHFVYLHICPFGHGNRWVVHSYQCSGLQSEGQLHALFLIITKDWATMFQFMPTCFVIFKDWHPSPY